MVAERMSMKALQVLSTSYPACRIIGAALLAAMLVLFGVNGAAYAQKAGGTLRGTLCDTPPSPSLLEEITASAVVPFMAVFNNLVIYDQSIARNTFDTIRPELATAWTVSDDGRQVRFTLRQGVKWHDGKPFTAADVRCTFDLLMAEGRGEAQTQSAGYLVRERRAGHASTRLPGHLSSQGAAALAPGVPGGGLVGDLSLPRAAGADAAPSNRHWSVQVRRTEEQRARTLEKNRDYWKPSRPYLDAIDYTIIPNRATGMLAFAADASI